MSAGRGIVTAVAAFLALGVGVDALLGETSPFPGYAAAIGFLGCVVIIIAYSWLATHVVGRPEEYYPDDVPPDRHDDLAAPVRPGDMDQERGDG